MISMEVKEIVKLSSFTCSTLQLNDNNVEKDKIHNYRVAIYLQDKDQGHVPRSNLEILSLNIFVKRNLSQNCVPRNISGLK